MALTGALATDPRALLWVTSAQATNALALTGDCTRTKEFVLDLARFFTEADGRDVS